MIDVAIGAACIAFGLMHVVWGQRMYDFYQRHTMSRWLTGSTLGAMRVHGALLSVLGVVVISVTVVRS